MKVSLSLSPVLFLAAALAGQPVYGEASGKVTFQDQVLPIFKNACVNCHNPDKKKAGLDLSTYQATLAGSDNGKVVESGNSGNSLLVKCCKQTEEPKMPPKGDKLSEADIALLEKWIAGQLLETATGKAVVTSNKVQAAVVSLTRPDGPPPMPPTDLPLEPFVHTKGNNALVALAASPWAPLVAVGGQKQIILYNTETLQPLGILPFPEGFPSVIRFSRNGKLLMTGGGLGGKSGKVVLWDIETGERAGEVGNEFDQVLGADLSPDQAHVALGGPGKILKIYSTKDGKLEHTIKKHTDWITAVAYSPDGKYLASADRNGGVAVWEGATGQEFTSLAGHKAAVTALAFMPGVLASAGEDGKITLWDVKEGKEIRTWDGHAGGTSSVDFTPDGRLVSAGRDKLVKAWDQTGKAIMTTEPLPDIALRAVMVEDRVIAGDWAGNIRVYNLKDGGKRQGDLTSNPLPLAENLAAASKSQAEAKAAEAASTQAVASVEAAYKAAIEAQTQKLSAEKVAAENTARESQTELDALKGSLAALEAEGPAAWTRVAEAEKAVAAAAEPDRAGAQKALDEAKAALAGKEAQLAQAQERVKKELPALEKKQQETAALVAKRTDALAQFVKAPTGFPQEAELAKLRPALEAAKARVAAETLLVERWQRAQAFMIVHRSRQNLADLKLKQETLTATVKDALLPISQAESDLVNARKTLEATPALLQEKEAALAAARSASDQALKAAADADAVLPDKEKQGKAAKEAEAKTAAELPALTKRQMTAKAAVDRQSTADKPAPDSPEAAALEAKNKAEQEELAKSDAALAQGTKAQAEAKQQLETLTAEITKAKEAITATKLTAKKAVGELAKAEAGLAATRKAGEDAQKVIAELTQKSGEIAATAREAKAKAEQDLVICTKQLEAAKAEAERTRTEYETRYRAAASPASPSPESPKPLAAAS